MEAPDTSIISNISQTAQIDPTAGIAKAYQLKDLINRDQMNQLSLNQAKMENADMMKARQVLQNSDLSTVEGQQKAGAELTKINPKTGMDFLKQVSANQKEAAALTSTELDLHEKKSDVLASNVQGMLSTYQDMINKGVPPQVANAQMQAQYQKTVMGLIDQKLPNGEPLLNQQDIKNLVSHPNFDPQFLNGIAQSNLKAKDQIQILRQQQADAETRRHNQESERHQGVEESQGQQRINIENRRLKMQEERFSGESGDLMAALAERGVSLPAGFRSKEQQRSLLNGLISRHPDMNADQIADGIRSGQLGFTSDKTQASVLGRREAAILPVEKSITKPGGFLDQAEKAVNDVDFSKLKAAGAFENWKGDQLSDPNLTKYRAAVAELRAEYALVLSKGGQVTDAARHEAAKVIPDLITKDQFKSIRQTVNQGIEASKGGVEESLSDVTGGSRRAQSNGNTVHWDDLK